MGRKITRRFYEYSLQAHGHGKDYEPIFVELKKVPRAKRLARVGFQQIFISDVTKIAGGIMIRAHGIKRETDYSTFDMKDLSITDDALPENKRFAVAAHGFLKGGGRRFYFEYVRGGPKADDVISAIQQILHRHSEAMRKVRLDLTPVVGEQFLQSINKLERVRLVRIDVAEPNADWTDWDDPLHELGKDSGADHVTLQAVAPRSESLKKNKGIFSILKQALKAPNSHLKKAVVEGKVAGEPNARVIQSDKHKEFETRQVDADSGGSTAVLSARAVFEDIARKDRKN